MTRVEFLHLLEQELQSLPKEERERSLAFYDELLQDRMEDGMEEAQAVAALESPRAIAEGILMETPLPKLVKEKVKRESRGMPVWAVVLLIVGSPVWVPLLIGAAVTYLALYVGLWSVVIALYATAFALAVSGLALLVGIAGFFIGEAANALAQVGLALVCMGAALFVGVFAHYGAKALVKVIRVTARGLKRMFMRKEATA